MKTGALPYVGLATGTAATVLGSAQLSHLWTAGPQISKEEKWKVGLVGFGLILMGVTLSSVSAYELGEERTQTKRLANEEEDAEDD